MAGITLDQLDFDPTAVADGPGVGAYITDGTEVANVNASNELQVRDDDANTSLDNIETAVTGTLTVQATDLDIRDLVNTQDSIAIGDETTLVDMAVMDSAFGVTSAGFPIMGIRQDAAGSPVSADGDAHPLVFNDMGELRVAAALSSSVADDAADAENPIKVGGRGVSGALTALSATGDRFDLLGDLFRRVWVNTAPNVGANYENVTVTTTAAEVLGTALAGRRWVTIQNRGNKSVFLGNDGSVTSANGIEIPKKTSATYEWGPDIDIFLIAGTGSQDVRLLELA